MAIGYLPASMRYETCPLEKSWVGSPCKASVLAIKNTTDRKPTS